MLSDAYPVTQKWLIPLPSSIYHALSRLRSENFGWLISVIVDEQLFIMSSSSTGSVTSPNQHVTERLPDFVNFILNLLCLWKKKKKKHWRGCISFACGTWRISHHSYLPDQRGLLLATSLCTERMTGTRYITFCWLKIQPASAKFMKDGGHSCSHVACCNGSWDLAANQHTAART